MRLEKKFGFLIGVSAPLDEVNEEVFNIMYDTAEEIKGVLRSNLQVMKEDGRLFIYSPTLKSPKKDLTQKYETND